jgi:ABC-type multidrug transport system ATPase subunit
MGTLGVHPPPPTPTPRPHTPGDSAVSLRCLGKSYRAGVSGCFARVQALRDIDLDIAPGEALGILGTSGAGKTTLLLALAGLLRPDSGQVSWFGRAADAGGRPPGIAYVPDRTTHYAFMSVQEAVEYHATMRDVTPLDRSTAVHDALSHMGLAGAGALPVSSLSWGSAQRLAVAQALVGRPRILLLDDTLTGLDAAVRREMALALSALVAGGLTLVVASDELAALNAVATRVAVMSGGRITGVVPPGELRQTLALELTVLASSPARRPLGARVAEAECSPEVIRFPLGDATPEEILAHCRDLGLEVRTSRIVRLP